MSKTERNRFTGTIQNKPSGDVLNPFTGQYHKADNNNDAQQEDSPQVEKKSGEPQWPSISVR